MALRLFSIAICGAAIASQAFGQTGPNCDGYGIDGSGSTAISGSAWVNSGPADDAGGPFTRDCTVSVTALQGQHYLQLTFTEWFNAQVSDPWGLCTDPSNCTVSMTWTLTSGGTTLDTTTASGYSGPSPALPGGGSWTYLGDFNPGTSYESLDYVRTVVKLIDVSALTVSGDVTLQWEVSGTEGGICGFGSSDTMFPVFDGLQIVQPATPNAVDSTSPSVVPVTSTDMDSSFAADDTGLDLTVLMNSGTVTVNVVNAAPSGSSIQWEVDRDPVDTVDSAIPTLSVSGAQVTFSPSAAGNFVLVAYVDLDGSGTFDEGEQVGVVSFAVVKSTLQEGSDSYVTLTTMLSADGASGATTDGSIPMSIIAHYLLEGGGADRTIGTTDITIGDVGNLLNDTFTVAYPVPTPTPASPGNVAGTETEYPGGPTPMVDAAGVAATTQPTGGATPFRGNSATADATPPTSGGRVVVLTSLDAPVFDWNNLHPVTGNTWGSTSGSNAFREFAVAFSSSFPKTYLALNQADWTVTVIGGNNGANWVDTGSSVSGDTGWQTVSGNLQVLGLSFGTNNVMQHTP